MPTTNSAPKPTQCCAVPRVGSYQSTGKNLSKCERSAAAAAAVRPPRAARKPQTQLRRKSTAERMVLGSIVSGGSIEQSAKASTQVKESTGTTDRRSKGTTQKEARLEGAKTETNNKPEKSHGTPFATNPRKETERGPDLTNLEGTVKPNAQGVGAGSEGGENATLSNTKGRHHIRTCPCSPPPQVYSSPDSRMAAEWKPPQATCPTRFPIKAWNHAKQSQAITRNVRRVREGGGGNGCVTRKEPPTRAQDGSKTVRGRYIHTCNVLSWISGV